MVIIPHTLKNVAVKSAVIKTPLIKIKFDIEIN